MKREHQPHGVAVTASIQEVLAALRGTIPAKPYDARGVTRTLGNTDCRTLPVLAAMGLSPDLLAEHAHAVGLGPNPRRSMSHLARQQGDTFDRRVLTDGQPLLQALHADGYLDAETSTVVNVDDEVPSPADRHAASASDTATEKRWQRYHRARQSYTQRAHADALTRSTPTLLLRGVVETTVFAGTPMPTFGEFDFALIYPPGADPANQYAWTALSRQDGPRRGVTVLGDAKSWRRLGRLDNGEKRAGVATQVGLYCAAASKNWGSHEAATIQPIGLIANPSSAGGLSTVQLTRVDLADALRTLQASSTRGPRTVANSIPQLAQASAHNARLDPSDAAATVEAVRALLRLNSWRPSCLTRCPLAQVCRRQVTQDDSTQRLGSVADESGTVTTISRLQYLLTGAPPADSEFGVASTLSRGAQLLGPAVPLPGTQPDLAQGSDGGL